MIVGGRLSHKGKGLLCPDCGELVRKVHDGRGACRICGQVDDRQGWAVAVIGKYFPGAFVCEEVPACP